MFIGMSKSSKIPSTWRLVRTAEGDLDAVTVVNRAKSFGAAVDNVGNATLLVMRDESAMISYVIAPGHPNAERLVSDLANAVGARAEMLDPSPDTGLSVPPNITDAPVIGVVVARPSDVAARDSQAGADPTEVAKMLARSMRPGSWVAVSVRGYRRSEGHKVRRWYAHRMTGLMTHHTNESEAVIVSFMAGGESADEVRSLLTRTVATLPGFDIDVRVKIVSSTLPSVLVSAAATVGAWGGLGFGAPHVHHHWSLAVAASAPLGLLTLGLGSGFLPTQAKRIERRLDSGTLPAPRHRHLPARKPRKESTNSKTGKTVAATSGDYPLHPTAFLVSPSVVIGIVSPHTGTSSGAAVTQVREPSRDLVEDIGPMVGYGGADRRDVHISASDFFAGVGVLGSPGVGKTVLVQSLFAWSSLERVRPSGKQGRPGRTNTLIAFENKGEGAIGYQKWIATTGDSSLMIEVADPGTPAIDLFSVPGTAEQRAAFFVNSMVYAMGEGAIAYQSSATLNAVLTAALLVTPEVAAVAEVGDDLSPVTYAHILLTGWGDEEGQKLAMSIIAHGRALDPDNPLRDEYIVAARGLAPLYGKAVTPAQRRTLCAAPMSKTKLLAVAEDWWSPKRPKITWRQVLEQHWAIVVNSGVSTSGHLIDNDVSTHLSSMMMYGLRDAIMRTCSGWSEEGRSVSIFADELSLLAGSSPDVITWFRNQGRSYGVRPVLATQYPDQLDPAVKKALMSFATVFWFTQTDPQTVIEAAADLSMDGGNWTGADIANLEPYHAILRASINKRRQPAVPVTMGFWDDDRASFAADQGYSNRPSPGGQSSVNLTV